MIRIGQSCDIHQLITGRKLILGGVEINHAKGLLGHSDADVLTHAIGEAIIGALALGDLGTHFSDTDNKWKNVSSLVILQHIYEMMTQRNYEIINIDTIILSEKPKLKPYTPQMKQNIATVLHTSVENINIKATRGETLGFVGREEGIMAQAVVLIRKKVSNEQN